MEIEENLIEQKEPTKRFVIKKSIRVVILILLYLTICVQGMTVTIFNLANASIREEIRITEKSHEIFNIIFHFGEFISLICLMIVMRRPERKSTVLFSLFGSASLISFFQFSDNQMILMPAYFFTGYCVMSINIYIILWVDQFGMFSYKTLFLSLINLSKAIGVTLGHLLNYIYTPKGFKSSFLIETIVLFALGLCFIPIHKVYFQSDLLLYKGKFGKGEFTFKAKTQKEGDEDLQSCEGAESIYRYRRSGASTKDFDLLFIIYQFFKNRIFMSGLFANAIMISATGGLNRYVMSYINAYFSEPILDEWRLLKNKAIFNLVGPFCATVIIWFISFIFGNYHSKTTPALMFLSYLLTTICGNLVPNLTNNAYRTLVCLLYTMGSSAMVPYLQGVNLSGGTPSRKPFGVIIATSGGLFLGGLPAPYIYNTLLKSYPTEEVLRIFMRFLWVGAFFDFMMMVFKYQAYPKKPEIKKNVEPPVELSEKKI